MAPLNSILLFLLLKGSPNETQVNVSIRLPETLYGYCLPYSQEKHPLDVDRDARRNPPVSDALLLPPARVQERDHDEKRKTETDIQH